MDTNTDLFPEFMDYLNEQEYQASRKYPIIAMIRERQFQFYLEYYIVVLLEYYEVANSRGPI